MSNLQFALPRTPFGQVALAASPALYQLSGGQVKAGHLADLWKRITYFGAAATVGLGLLGAAPAAAQQANGSQACKPGGYWYLQKEGRGNAIALACPGGASFEEVPTVTPRPKARATNPQDCEPGGYWWIETEEAPWTAVPMKC